MRIEPRLKEGDGGGFVDVRADRATTPLSRFFAKPGCCERAARFGRREPLVPELDVEARSVGETLRERAGLPCRVALSSFHVERKPHDETSNARLARELHELGEELRLGMCGERAARMGERTEIVVDGNAHARVTVVERTHVTHGRHLTRSLLSRRSPGKSMDAMTDERALQAVKGMNDVLPHDSAQWQRVESAYRRAMALHGFREVRTPIVEPTRLFVRAVGEATDIVEKEMYSFRHHDDDLTLRPEGTAGAARAYVEHGVHKQEPVTRWYYLGWMFRAETPQRGRYRQFAQAGAEIFGDVGPGCDAEMIALLVSFFESLGIPDLRVLVNSIGSGEARARFREALRVFFEAKKSSLSEDSQRRIATNPMRILDSKDPRDKSACEGAGMPTMHEFLDDADKAHFDGLRRMLDALGVKYEVDPKLVRGLDYYTRTIFEIKGATSKLGAGDTLVGGGRYDNMIEELGGPKAPAIGFAAGVDRLLIAAEPQGAESVVDAFVAPLGEVAQSAALVLARELRQRGISVEADTRGGSLKSLLRRANALGARVVLIVGEGELARNVVTLKDLAGHAQEEVPRADAAAIVADRLAASGAVHKEDPK